MGNGARQVRLVAAAILTLSLAGVACGDDGDATTPDTAAPDDTAPPDDTTTTATIAPPSLPTSAAGSAEPGMRQLTILGGPDWLVASDEGVWVKLDRGVVVLIDPATVSVTAEVEVQAPGDGLCQGIGIGFGSVWTCSGTDVVRVDLASRAVVSRLELDKAQAQGHLVAAAGRLWVLTGDGDTLVGVDPSTERVVTTFELAIRGTDLAAGETGLWVISKPDDRVIRIDVDTGATLGDTPVNTPVSITTTHGVWVAGVSELHRLDPITGAVAQTIDVAAGLSGSIATDDTSVWVRNENTFLTELDGASGEVLRTYASDATSGGDMIRAFGQLWTTAFDDATLFAIPLTQ